MGSKCLHKHMNNQKVSNCDKYSEIKSKEGRQIIFLLWNEGRRVTKAFLEGFPKSSKKLTLSLKGKMLKILVIGQ